MNLNKIDLKKQFFNDYFDVKFNFNCLYDPNAYDTIQNINILGNENFKLKKPKLPSEKNSVKINNSEKNTFIKLMKSSYNQFQNKWGNDKFTDEIKNTLVDWEIELTNSLQFIDTRQLLVNVKKCVEILNEKLSKENNPDYSIGVAQNKSTEWMAELAWQHLAKKPSSGFALDSGGVLGGDLKSADFTKIIENILVIFDDCAYSGDQMSQYINQIKRSRKNNEQLRIYAVIPFVSPKASELIKKALGKNGELITSPTRIKLAREIIFNTGKYDTLEKWIFEIRGETDFVESLSTLDFKKHTLCFTEWKIPDNQSFPDIGRYKVKNSEGNEKFIRKTWIDKGVSPYKKN